MTVSGYLSRTRVSAPDPEFAQPLAGSGRVACGSGVGADPQGTVEGVRRTAAVTVGQPDATQILEHGRQRQRPRPGSENRRRLFQVWSGPPELASGVRGGSGHGRHAGIEFVSARGEFGDGLGPAGTWSPPRTG